MQRYTNENDDDIVTSARRAEYTFDGGMTGLAKLLSNETNHNNSNEASFHHLPATSDIPVIESKSAEGGSNHFAHHHRKGTESTMSSSPPVEIDESNSSHHYQQHIVQEGGGMFFTTSPSLSPNPQSFDKQQQQQQPQNLSSSSKEVIDLSSKLSVSHKSPIGKVQRQQSQPNTHYGNSHQTITSSPSLSLTPNSTDGSSFIISPGAAAFLGTGATDTGPSMPFLFAGSANATAAFQSHLDGNGSVTGSVIHHPQQSHHRRGESSSFGSFDLSHGGGVGPSTAGNSDVEDDDNDGLFGLGALHYRASTLGSNVTASDGTPALISSATSSPRVARRQTYHSSDMSSSGLQPRRTSTHSERPPLSSQYLYGESNSTTAAGSYGSNSDRAPVGSLGAGDASPPTLTGFGAIGQLRLNAAEFDPNRRRSSSDYNASTSFGYIPQSQPQSQTPADIAQKFGTLPTLSTHIQNQHQLQQNMNNIDNIGSTFADLSKPRHTRSISQPIPPGMGNTGNINTGMSSTTLTHDPQRYYGASSSSYDGKNSSAGYSSRSSLSQQHLQGGFSYEKQSAPNFAHRQMPDGFTGALGYGSLEKGFDNFNISAESQSSTGNFIGAYSGDGTYGRSGRNSNSSSPGPNQNQYLYNDGTTGSTGGNSYQHVRHQSDNGMMMNSSQSLPLGLSSGLPRFDEDYSHALAGENIDVPDHDDSHALPPYYTSSGSHPLLRGATHSHSMSLDAIQTQQFMQSAAPSVVYAVKFKRSQRNFILGPRINRDLKIGTYVKVEADRGEDLGIVVGKLPPEKFTNSFTSRSSFTAGMGPSPVGSSLADLKRIMRLATHDEVSLLGLKREEEEELLQICRSKVRQRGLRMNVIDAEYQFDRHKLTFFFEAMGRVDFRELVRDLFSMYKTRIWMQQLDKNTSTSAQAMIYPTANLQMDYGTPIIAPTSEFADSIMYGQNPSNISSYGGTDYDRSN